MILVTYWYDIPEIPDNETTNNTTTKSKPNKIDSIVLDNITDKTTIKDIKDQLYKHLKVPPTHQSLEQPTGTKKRQKSNPMVDSSEYKNIFSNDDDLVIADLGVVLQKKTFSKSKMTATFRLKTRIAVQDYHLSSGKFFRKFNYDGSYHRETISEAMSKSFTSQLFFWMWKKHFITRLALIAFLLVGLLSLLQTLMNMSGFNFSLVEL